MSKPEQPAARAALRVGFVPGVTLTKWRGIWRERFPRTPLIVVEVAEHDQRRVLDAGEVDLCFARLPLDTEGLHRIRLYDEVPVVVAPRDHPLAAFDEVSLADLTGEPLVDPDLADAFDRVAWGSGVLLVPHSIARSHSRRDLVYRPVTDAEPTTVVLAWTQDNPNPLIEEFIGIVRGRTANSSRTAADRAARATSAGPAKRQSRASAGSARRTRGGDGRRRSPGR